MASTRGARPTRRSGRPSTTSTATSVTPTASRVTTRAAASPTSTTSSGQDVGKAPKLKVRARRGDGGGGERRRDAGEMVTIPGRSLTVQTPGSLEPADKLAEVMAFLPGRTNAAQMATNLTLLEQGLPPNLEEIELYGPRKVRVGGRSSTTRVRARRKGGDSGPSPLGGVNELFWQGPRGVNL